jgi:hypothetical protein
LSDFLIKPCSMTIRLAIRVQKDTRAIPSAPYL